jgi:hypothetical protein
MATGSLARCRRTAHEFNLEPSDLGKPRAERLPLLRQWAIDATCQVPAAPRGCSVTTWMLPPYFTAGLKSMEKLTERPLRHQGLRRAPLVSIEILGAVRVIFPGGRGLNCSRLAGLFPKHDIDSRLSLASWHMI